MEGLVSSPKRRKLNDDLKEENKHVNERKPLENPVRSSFANLSEYMIERTCHHFELEDLILYKAQVCMQLQTEAIRVQTTLPSCFEVEFPKATKKRIESVEYKNNTKVSVKKLQVKFKSLTKETQEQFLYLYSNIKKLETLNILLEAESIPLSLVDETLSKAKACNMVKKFYFTLEKEMVKYANQTQFVDLIKKLKRLEDFHIIMEKENVPIERINKMMREAFAKHEHIEKISVSMNYILGGFASAPMFKNIFIKFIEGIVFEIFDVVPHVEAVEIYFLKESICRNREYYESKNKMKGSASDILGSVVNQAAEEDDEEEEEEEIIVPIRPDNQNARSE